jgi:hypothetical protein
MTNRMTIVEHRLESRLEGCVDLRSTVFVASKEILQGSGIIQLSAKKVELHSFTSKDPIAWRTRAEKYFEVQRISEELPKLSMEGPTIHWFNIWRHKT